MSQPELSKTNGKELHYADHQSGSTATLTIDLTAIGENYRTLASMAKGAECAAVVKANAYGTGLHKVARSLHGLGCRTFFVATLKEGIELRALLLDAKIYILDGLFSGAASLYAEHNLCPVLGSLSMINEWSIYLRSSTSPLPAALHVDTGMNRLGVGQDEWSTLLEQLSDRRGKLSNISFDLIMSHLACADDPHHSRNNRQLQMFENALNALPAARASLANSAGVFLGPSYHFDVLRPGIALYGGRATNNTTNPMCPVVTLGAPIAQIRTVEKGDAIGYGAAYIATRQTKLATLLVGYADGYHRALGSTNEQQGASVYFGEHRAPLLGRVSMDLITVDITDIPQEHAIIGATAELLGSHVTVDDLADIAGTIGYEILTSFGDRYDRHYKGE